MTFEGLSNKLSTGGIYGQLLRVYGVVNLVITEFVPGIMLLDKRFIKVFRESKRRSDTQVSSVVGDINDLEVRLKEIKSENFENYGTQEFDKISYKLGLSSSSGRWKFDFKGKSFSKIKLEEIDFDNSRKFTRKNGLGKMQFAFYKGISVSHPLNQYLTSIDKAKEAIV